MDIITISTLVLTGQTSASWQPYFTHSLLLAAFPIASFNWQIAYSITGPLAS